MPDNGAGVPAAGTHEVLAGLMVLHVWGLDAGLDHQLLHLASLLGWSAAGQQPAAQPAGELQQGDQ